jgi:hypothetical protein
MSPFTINIPKVDGPPPRTPSIVADRRLYLTLDEQTLVEDGDATARFLLAAPGGAIPGSEVDRLQLVVVDGRIEQARGEQLAPVADPTTAGANESTDANASVAAPVTDPPATNPPSTDESKERKPGENKQRKPADNK